MLSGGVGEVVSHRPLKSPVQRTFCRFDSTSVTQSRKGRAIFQLKSIARSPFCVSNRPRSLHPL
jgi:hypothetical protein